MNRRDFTKLTAAGLLALAIPWTFPEPITVESTLESMGFKKSHDLLKVRVGSFKGSDLERTFEVNQSYHHEKGWLRLMKYTKGKGVHLHEFECPWGIEWTPYQREAQFISYMRDERALVESLNRLRDRWRS
jgi:hypothetical protein